MSGDCTKPSGWSGKTLKSRGARHGDYPEILQPRVCRRLSVSPLKSNRAPRCGRRALQVVLRSDGSYVIITPEELNVIAPMLGKQLPKDEAMLVENPARTFSPRGVSVAQGKKNWSGP